MSTNPIIPMPISELADRMTIARLKLQRLKLTEVEQHSYEHQATLYLLGLPLEENPALTQLVDDLHEINGWLWDAEAAITKAVREGEDMALVGTLALEVRDRNRARAIVKNRIIALTGDGFPDIKGNYGAPLEG